jgi:hypothetical protein
MTSNTTINAQTINANSVITEDFIDYSSGAEHRWVVGYADSSFNEQANGIITNLNNKPSLAANASPLKLPNNAFILRAFVTNNGTTVIGGTSFDIGTTATSAAASVNIFDGVTTAIVNTGGLQGMLIGDGSGTLANCLIDGQGQALTTATASGTAAGTVYTAAESFVTVEVNGNNSAGDLKVILEYIVL